jgi:hypothetical protein
VCTLSPCPLPHTPPRLARPPRCRLAPRCLTQQWWRVGVGMTSLSLKFVLLAAPLDIVIDLRADGQRVAYEALRGWQ